MITKFLVLILTLPIFAFTATPIFAQPTASSSSLVKYDYGILDNIERKEVVVLPKEVTINKDYFGWGERVTVSGTINGDAYLAGGNIVVEGPINGDLLAAGGTIFIKGKVKNNVRVVGGVVNISGEVGGNVSVAGGAVTITNNAKINGSLVAAAGNLDVFAPIGRGMTAGIGQLTIGSDISGDVIAGTGQISLTPNAKLNGNLNYWSNKKALLQQGATVSGVIKQNTPPEHSFKQFNPKRVVVFLAGASLVLKFIGLITYLIIGMLMLKFLPVYSQKTTNLIAEKPWNSLSIGILTLLLVPVAYLILMMTIVGIPLAFILMVGFLIELFLPKVYDALLIGQKTLEGLGQHGRKGWALLLGLVIYTVITLIPVLGGVVAVLATLFGLGAIVLAKLDFYKSFRSRNLL